MPLLRGIAGLLRYTTAKLDDGRMATFGAFENAEAARASTEVARQARAKPGSMLARLLPNPPEVLEGKVIFAHGQPKSQPVAAG